MDWRCFTLRVGIRCLVVVMALGLWFAAVFAQEGGAEPTPGHGACETNRALRLQTPAMQGQDVWELQIRLQELGYYQGPIDEVYHAEVAKAVEKFQADGNLAVDGVVGPQTWMALAAGVEPYTTETTAAPRGEISLNIDTERLRLTVYANGEPYKSYPVAVGRPKSTTLTPVGEWRIIHKGLDWGGGFGTRWIGLNVPWGIYGIHGTNKPYSIGRRASAGCIRMQNRDVEELYEWVSHGDRVTIEGVNPPYSYNRTLRPGMTAKEVIPVQLALRELGFDAGYADGRFGPATERAVREMQRVYELPVDGRVWTDVYVILGLR